MNREGAECGHAVLVPLVESAGELQVLFALRPLRRGDPYGGQVCFPGGRREPADRTLLDCALRETEEELGIPPEQIETFAEIDCHATRLHRAVKPFAGRVRPPLVLRPSPAEVDRVLYLPVRKLDAGLFESRRVHAGGREFESVAFELDGAIVWGLTARILQSFYFDSPDFAAAIRRES